MSMTPRERIMAVLNGEEPDRIPVCTYYLTTPLLPGGWYQRLAKRGLGAIALQSLYLSEFPDNINYRPYLPGVKYIQIHYMEKGLKKYRHTFETPVGSITSVMSSNPLPTQIWDWHTEEYFVKQPSDWKVVNYLSRGKLDTLAPNYEAMKMRQDELGDSGIIVHLLDKTPWQSAWVHWAGPERALIDFHEQPEEIQEFIETERRVHKRIAEFVAESPAKLLDVSENMTDMTSPKYFHEYCLPIYKLYKKQLEGTGKLLGAHLDGLLGRLKKEIAESPLQVIESFTVPPAGEVSLTEVKSVWPGKIIFMNCPPHLHWAKPEEVRKSYEALAEEWGSKKGLILNLSEDLPLETVEAHLSAAMDVFGY